ncbi:hypothetical protein BD847_1342 [Flavobacterium cutihirudinis]|uniref:Uncharacterized protein n=1 Tax=Flavobacterium cutihirudinis TaxID=1265740 RepID=A0A3D9FV33_9FLAO|nr:hypothetical protein BD847_1342 [Flavobacterium cutihirudinis]
MFFLTAITGFNVFAGVETPSPPATDAHGVATTNSVDPAPPDPNAPIDQNLEILLLGGLILGGVFIYKDKIKKKLQF